MEVILTEPIRKLGTIGEVVKVKRGFALNYLIPTKKALRATEENKKVFEKRLEELTEKNNQLKQEAQAIADQMDGSFIIMIRQAGDDGRLYGSVTTKDIAASLNNKFSNEALNASKIDLDYPIKTTGLHQIQVNIHSEVTITVKVNVARSETEANEALRQESVAQAREAKLHAPAEEQKFEEDVDLGDMVL